MLCGSDRPSQSHGKLFRDAIPHISRIHSADVNMTLHLSTEDYRVSIPLASDLAASNAPEVDNALLAPECLSDNTAPEVSDPLEFGISSIKYDAKDDRRCLQGKGHKFSMIPLLQKHSRLGIRSTTADSRLTIRVPPISRSRRLFCSVLL